MKKILLFVALMLPAVVLGAQEMAQYRIAYDCDAQFGPMRKIYRWHLDIGAERAVFYNPSTREMDKVMEDIVSDNDVSSVMTKLKSIKTRFPSPNPLEVLVPAAPEGKYTYLNKINNDKLCYEEPKPAIAWKITERDTTVCGYTCLQARGRVYGREWTVWFAPEIPLSYGPYIFGGLPGLILDAEDADGLFHFTAVGLEQNPGGATVALEGAEKAIRCSRSKYLKIRERANGQSLSDSLRELGVDDKAVVRVVTADGKDVDMDASRPKQNYLDLE